MKCNKKKKKKETVELKIQCFSFLLNTKFYYYFLRCYETMFNNCINRKFFHQIVDYYIFISIFYIYFFLQYK